MNNNWIKISAVWKKQSKNGQIFYSGKLGEANIIIWPTKKELDTPQFPDFNIFIVPKVEKQENQSIEPPLFNTNQGIPF